MSDPLFDEEDDAATPLTPDERTQLIPTWISTRAQLNVAEQIGIADADRWAFRRRRDGLDEGFLLVLHKRMLGGVWTWAGTVRTTERNIGIPAHQIDVALRALMGDARYWIENKSYGRDEIAVRYHHRLVAIHPFPNGNGRHARLAADLLIVGLGGERFTWGSASLVEAVATRARYIAALRAADDHDIRPLIAFSRS